MNVFMHTNSFRDGYRVIVVTLSIQYFVLILNATGDKETFLQDFLNILKRRLQNIYKILKKYFLYITYIVIYLTYLQPLTIVLPVAKWLKL